MGINVSSTEHKGVQIGMIALYCVSDMDNCCFS